MLHRGYIIFEGETIKDVRYEEVLIGVPLRSKGQIALRIVSQNSLFVISGTSILWTNFSASLFVILGTRELKNRSSF
jgi:hypothetical protein